MGFDSVKENHSINRYEFNTYVICLSFELRTNDMKFQMTNDIRKLTDNNFKWEYVKHSLENNQNQRNSMRTNY